MKLMLLMLLVAEVGLQVQEREVLDIPIVPAKTGDGLDPEPEPEDPEEVELRRLKQQEFEHLHGLFVELIHAFTEAGLFKRVLLHCIQSVPHTTSSSKRRVEVQ